MTLSKNPENWLFAALVIIFLVFVLIIYKHHQEDADLQQRIDDHSEIVDKVRIAGYAKYLSG